MPTRTHADTGTVALHLMALGQRHLNAARAALNGTTSLPPRRRTRAAAVFARGALEHVVDAALLAKGHDFSEAGMRVRLICLGILVDREAGESAAVAWGGLSQGCHQHAYELSPTFSEVEHLIALVEKAAAATTGAAARSQN